MGDFSKDATAEFAINPKEFLKKYPVDIKLPFSPRMEPYICSWQGAPSKERHITHFQQNYSYLHPALAIKNSRASDRAVIKRLLGNNQPVIPIGLYFDDFYEDQDCYEIRLHNGKGGIWAYYLPQSINKIWGIKLLPSMTLSEIVLTPALSEGNIYFTRNNNEAGMFHADAYSIKNENEKSGHFYKKVYMDDMMILMRDENFRNSRMEGALRNIDYAEFTSSGTACVSAFGIRDQENNAWNCFYQRSDEGRVFEFKMIPGFDQGSEEKENRKKAKKMNGQKGLIDKKEIINCRNLDLI